MEVVPLEGLNDLEWLWEVGVPRHWVAQCSTSPGQRTGPIRWNRGLSLGRKQLSIVETLVWGDLSFKSCAFATKLTGVS